MNEDNSPYLMACSKHIQSHRIEEICEHLNSKGYNISDLYFIDSSGVEINGEKYSYENISEIPVKDSGLEEKLNE